MYLLLICTRAEPCGSRLISYFSSLPYLLLLECKLYATRGGCWPLGAAYRWPDRARHCRNGRWPSFPCSSGHCFWVLGYCSGDKQTALLRHRSGNTGPRTPRTPSCRDLMSEIENRRYFNSEGRKTFKMCIRKSLAFNDSRNFIPDRVEFNMVKGIECSVITMCFQF